MPGPAWRGLPVHHVAATGSSPTWPEAPERPQGQWAALRSRISGFALALATIIFANSWKINSRAYIWLILLTKRPIAQPKARIAEALSCLALPASCCFSPIVFCANAARLASGTAGSYPSLFAGTPVNGAAASSATSVTPTATLVAPSVTSGALTAMSVTPTVTSVAPSVTLVMPTATLVGANAALVMLVVVADGPGAAFAAR